MRAATKTRTEYEAVIGLEVHAELQTRSKVFCGCPTRFGAEPNTQVCPVCLGLPGVLPVLNRRALEHAIRAGVALGCTIARECKFDRKNYFYPDLPKGYQISQYDRPVASGGHLTIEAGAEAKRIGIRRVHLEEDTGKSLHGGIPGVYTTDPEHSILDFNRAGVPLLEIVSEPDLRSPAEADAYLRELRAIMLYTGISDVRMEEGSFRVDVNVSVRPRGHEDFGALVEVKNLNSFRSVERALEYDLARQIRLLEAGEAVVRETRHWDEDRQVTFSSRTKEEAHDYRYFPEPDLVPVSIDPAWVDEIHRTLPELPEARRRRYTEQYELSAYDARVLTASRAMADFFEEVVARCPQPKTVANWVMGELFRLLNQKGLEPELNPVPPEHLAELLELLDKGTISGPIAKQVFEEAFETGKGPGEIVERRGLVQISDEEALAATIRETLGEHPAVVEQIRGGKEQAMGFLVGQVMRKTRGRANPQVVTRLLREMILN